MPHHSKKKALITGITGQDGSYLAEFLISCDYDVYGIVRRASTNNLERLSEDSLDKIILIGGDLLDQSSLTRIISEIRPDEIYNLAAQSRVSASFAHPIYTAEVTALGTTRILEAIRQTKRNIKFFQASSSEQFGNSPAPQNENTSFRPCNPYGIAKTYAHHTTVNYRKTYGIFACCGIMFNHCSPRQNPEFVTRKIAQAAASIKLGLKSNLRLGNLHTKRDFGYAGDYVKAMWQILQQDKPDDYVIATGESHTIKEFLESAFRQVGLNSEEYVVIDPNLFRPTDIEESRGDITKIKAEVGWSPHTTFGELVSLMVDTEYRNLSKKL
jgi:GDPmannose 4,6-dehydratase